MSQFSSAGGRSPRLVKSNGIMGCILDTNSYIINIQVGFVVAFMSMVVCSE